MDIINNRYRVVKLVNQNKLYFSYVVHDLKRKNKALKLNIINDERVSKTLLDYYIKEFITLTNINSNKINRVYNFGIVNLVDNKKINDIRYFYTYDYFDANKDFKSIVTNINEETKILDLFVQICKALNYLHLKGFTYDELNLSNIYAHVENDDIKIKLKDLATVKLEKYSFGYTNSADNSFLFKDTKLIGEHSIANDIYSLGILLLSLCSKKIDINAKNSNVFDYTKQIINPNNIIDNIKDGFSQKFINNSIKIITKCTDNNLDKRYQNINELITDINVLFDKKFIPLNVEELCKLKFNSKLIGRDEDIEKVIDLYDAIQNYSNGDKIVLVHGETGIGKTKFLKAIKHLLIYKKANIYTSFRMNKQLNEPFKEIIKQIILECDNDIIQKYKPELMEIEPKLPKNNKDVSSIYQEKKERLKLLNRMQCFINDFTKYKSIVIIVDDIHLADDISIDLLEYLCERQVKNKNILLILSYCDGEHVLNKRILDLIEKIKFNNNVTNMYLNSLNKVQTGEMIKNILSMHQAPKKFSNLIYKKTYGNPLFTQEIIKNFFVKGIIYVDKETGLWSTDWSYDKFPIPSDINQILLNTIKGIDSISYDILSTIAVFLDPVSANAISYLNNCSEDKIEKYITNLMDKGILCKKIGDEGFVYDFYNKLLKDIIYEKMDRCVNVEKHRLASSYLEEQYLQGHAEYLEELIYHLEKSNQKLKVINYCITNACKMKKLNNYIEAKNNIEKAIKSIENTNLTYKKIMLYLAMCELKKRLGDFENLIEYYQLIVNEAEKMKFDKLKIDCCYEIAAIYYDRNDISKASEYLNKAVKILKSIRYLNGYLECYNLICKILITKDKYEESYEICNKCIKLNNGIYKKFEGIFYNTLGNIYIMTSKIEDAIKIYKKSISIFEKIKYYEGLTIALNNLGVIYGDYYQDDKKALQYHVKIMKICKTNNIVLTEITALTNIGESFFYFYDYDLALKYFKEVEKKSKKYNYESSIFYSYIFICKIYLCINNYKKAYKYYLLANKELNDYPIQGKIIGEYYDVCAKLNLEFGAIDKAYEFALKEYNLYENDISILKLNSKFLLIYIKIYKSIMLKEDYDQLIDSAIETADNIGRVNQKIDCLCKVANLCYYSGEYLKGKKIIDKLNQIIKISKELNNIKLNIQYITAIYDNYDKINTLKKILESAVESDNKRLMFYIYNEIGKNYFDDRNYFYAIIYYCECCQLIIDLIEQIPLEYRNSFVKLFNIKEPFLKLNIITQYYSLSKDNQLEGRINSDFKLQDMKKVIKTASSSEIINNENFVKSIRKYYSINLNDKFYSINAVLNRLTSDNLENLKMILKFLIYVTMGTCAYIVDNEADNYEEIISSYGSKKLTQQELNIIKSCGVSNEPYLVSNLFSDKNTLDMYTDNNSKAYMCIPIVLNDFHDNYLYNRRKNNALNENKILGYVFIKSERVLNNINEKSLKVCLQLIKLIGIIIEKYKLNIVASQDRLTGTLTRKYLEESIENNIDRCSENNGIFSMIMFDLDHFKNINDKFGHQTGDMVLKEVCRIINKNIRKDDVCGRYGGEEFIILLNDASTQDAFKIAEKLRQSIQNAKMLDDKFNVTVSMGIVSYPLHAQWKQQLIEKVDQALYMAKESGRNVCKVWKEDFSSKVRGTNQLTGIITENEIQNNRNVLVMFELIDIINEVNDVNTKIYKLLGRIIEITEAQYGTLITVNDNKIVKSFTRENFKESWCETDNCNDDIINSVIAQKHGQYLIDWDNIIKCDSITGEPDWHSVIAVPLIKNNILNGILYLSVCIRIKEFNFNDFNFVNTLAKIISMGM